MNNLEDDGEEVIPPGGGVHVPLLLFDHQPRYFAGATDASLERGRRGARQQMIDSATSAWRRPARDAAPGPDDDPDADDPSEPASAREQELERWQGRDPAELARDVERRRAAIHRDFSQRLSEAWRGR